MTDSTTMSTATPTRQAQDRDAGDERNEAAFGRRAQIPQSQKALIPMAHQFSGLNTNNDVDRSVSKCLILLSSCIVPAI